MALKPGMAVDSRQGFIIGTTEKIYHKYVQENPNPDSDKLKEIFIKEAECFCTTTLDSKINLPIGIDYINGSLNSKDTCQTIETKTAISQMCLSHIITKKATNSVLQETLECTSSCNECLEQGEVCPPCIENGHKFVEPSLRACTSCLTENTKCVKAITLVFSMDSESRNGAAQVMFDERKNEHIFTAHIDLCECLPDPVHFGKRISRQFSNWYLIVNGYRINRVQLHTLTKHLTGHLSVAACRNRDRMDVESMLEISSQQVRNAISSNVETITDTIIPEKFRVHESKKKGLLDSPTVVCMGPSGTVYVCDAAKGKLFSA